MATVAETSIDREGPGPRRATNPALRIIRYALVRAFVLALMVVVGVFVAVVVINYGGYVDDMKRAEINEALNYLSLSMPGATIEQVREAALNMQAQMVEAAGLNRPFLERCARWTFEAVTFQWGVTGFFQAGLGPSYERNEVTRIVLERLPNTLMLAGLANLLLVTVGIVLALALVRRQGGLLDRLVIGLSPISSVPNWVYGVVLTVLLAGELHLLPFGGMFDDFPPATKAGYIGIVLKHMILPVTAIFLSQVFQVVYTWRTFFLIHSGEDYVELARAKGLRESAIERRYVLRPAMPYMLTSFTLMLITFWQGVLVLERFFDWPGVGSLFLTAVENNLRDITVAVIVLFALLLAASVFVLDLLYAVVDPRVKVAGRGQAVRPAARRRLLPLRRGRRAAQDAAGAKGREQAGAPETVGALHAQSGPASGPPSPRSPSAPVEGRDSDPVSSTRKQEQREGAGAEGGPERPRRRGGALSGLAAAAGAMLRYPAAVLGLLIIAGLIGLSVYAMVAIPYRQAVEAWRPEAAEKSYRPKNALPAWVNRFRKDPLPETIVQSSADGTALKTVGAAQGAGQQERTTITFTVDYPYSAFPENLTVTFATTFQAKKPFVALTWRTPDGRTMDLGGFSIVSGQAFSASENMPRRYLQGLAVRQLAGAGGTGGASPSDVLFMRPADLAAAVPGRYTLRVDGYTFEPGSTVDAELVMPGKVYGLAGTDHLRRDLSVALLWGTPVALFIGFAGAIATSLLSMLVAATGTWFGGWVDDLVQRLTEVNMLLPALPMAIMVFYLYSHSVWVILGVLVALSVFGSGIKTYRAAFLQVKEAPYVEAAQAYGARSWRMIRRYLVPRILPLMIPQLVILIPTYVFFEATLAYLKISDPNLPTWGKVVYDAVTSGVPNGHYYWLLEPIALMMITGLAFAMVGFALDSLLNPRLRRQ